MKKINRYKILVVFMFLTFLSGCWNIKDIDKRALPLVIGITKENNKDYKVVLQIPITKRDSKISRIVTGKGETVSSVLGQIGTNSEDAVDYSQIQLIVIQNNLANNQQELRQLIKNLINSKEIPPRALFAITDDNIQKVLSNINNKLGVNVTAIYDYFNKGTGWAPEISRTRIWEVYRSLFTYTKDIAVPVVRSGKDTVFNYEGSAVLKNGKITERLNPDESQLSNLFQNMKANGKIESMGFASIIVLNSSIQNKTSMKNNKPLVSSDLNLKIDILEKKEGITNNQIKKELERLIEKRFYHMFEQAQRSQTDIFGFGQYFRNQIPYHKLKHWREKYYPKLKVNFQVHASLE